MKTTRWLNLLFFLGVITVNALANILPINGKTTGAVSAMYDNYFTPAGFTFSIWSLIYLSLLVLVIYQFRNRTSKSGTSLDGAMGYTLIINFAANMAWIYAWHYGQFFMTLVLMLVILVTLVMLNVRTAQFSWVVKFPLQLYLGWICVATVANTAVLLTYLEWNAWGLEGWQWGIAMVLVAGLVATVLGLWRGYLVASLAVAWGIYGIYGKQINVPEPVTLYTSVCMGVILVVLLTVALKAIAMWR